MKLNYKLLIQKYQPQINQLVKRLQPLHDYWKKLTEREQQILAVGGIVVVLMILFSIVSMALDYRNDLKQNRLQLQHYLLDSQIIAANYKDLANVTPNDFSSVNSERIKGDVTLIMGVKNADIIFADNTLTIKASDVKFDTAMTFLDQLRKSYGLFPSKLKITRLSQSEHVVFSVTFNNVEQE